MVACTQCGERFGSDQARVVVHVMVVIGQHADAVVGVLVDVVVLVANSGTVRGIERRCAATAAAGDERGLDCTGVLFCDALRRRRRTESAFVKRAF